MADTRPIVIGPWRSEVGFEVLYWIPFVLHRLFVAQAEKSRVHVITRGGAGPWYGFPDDHTLDLFDLYSGDVGLAELREQAHRDVVQRGSLKQFVTTAFDREILDRACRHWGLRNPIILHPRTMYHVFRPFFAQEVSLEYVLQRTAWDLIPTPMLPEGLPPTYYVAGFYARATLSGHFSVVQRVNQIVRGIARHTPVVLLKNPHHLDDHVDLPIEGEGIQVASEVAPNKTLALHTALIGHSQGFLGTYGGISQLALRMKKPVRSFFQTLEGTSWAHLALSHWIAHQMGVSFRAESLREAELFTGLFDAVTPIHEGGGSSS